MRIWLKKHAKYLKFIFSTTVLVAIAVVIANQHESIARDISGISLAAAVSLVVLQLVSDVLKTEAWGQCIRTSTGKPVPRAELHGVSAPLTVAASFMPAAAGNVARFFLLQRQDTTRHVRVKHIAIGEATVACSEAVILILLLSFTSLPLGFSWYYFAFATAALIVVAAALYIVTRYLSTHRFVAAVDTIKTKRNAGKLFVLLLGAVILQPIRYWACLKALNLDATLANALGIFLVASLLSVLPMGTGMAGGSATAAILGAGAAGAASVGVLIAASSLIAAALYSLFTLYVLLPEMVRNKLRNTMSFSTRSVDTTA